MHDDSAADEFAERSIGRLHNAEFALTEAARREVTEVSGMTLRDRCRWAAMRPFFRRKMRASGGKVVRAAVTRLVHMNGMVAWRNVVECTAKQQLALTGNQYNYASQTINTANVRGEHFHGWHAGVGSGRRYLRLSHGLW